MQQILSVTPNNGVNNEMKTFRNYGFIYALGSVGYGLVEILWRGYTHWTMALTGGTCFVLLYRTNIRMAGKKLWQKCLAGSSLITVTEFIVGCVVNLKLKWNVWDYSNLPFNVKGQICLLYSVLWFFLCIPVLMASGKLQKYLSALPRMQKRKAKMPAGALAGAK